MALDSPKVLIWLLPRAAPDPSGSSVTSAPSGKESRKGQARETGPSALGYSRSPETLTAVLRPDVGMRQLCWKDAIGSSEWTRGSTIVWQIGVGGPSKLGQSLSLPMSPQSIKCHG